MSGWHRCRLEEAIGEARNELQRKEEDPIDQEREAKLPEKRTGQGHALPQLWRLCEGKPVVMSKAICDQERGRQVTSLPLSVFAKTHAK